MNPENSVMQIAYAMGIVSVAPFLGLFLYVLVSGIRWGKAGKVECINNFDHLVLMWQNTRSQTERRHLQIRMARAIRDSMKNNIIYWPHTLDKQIGALKYVTNIRYRFMQYLAMKNHRTTDISIVSAEEIADPMLVNFVAVIVGKMFFSAKNVNGVYSICSALYVYVFPEKQQEFLARKVLHANILRHKMRDMIRLEFGVMVPLIAVEYQDIRLRQKLIRLKTLCEIFRLQRLEMLVVEVFFKKMLHLMHVYKLWPNAQQLKYLDRFRSEITFNYPGVRSLGPLVQEVNPVHY